MIPEVVRKAFKVAQEPEARPDPHRAARGRDGATRSTPSRCPPRTQLAPAGAERAASCWRAAELIRSRDQPDRAGRQRRRRAPAPPPALREFARATGIGVAETFMGKGALDYEDPHALGTVGLQSRDYALAGFEDADVVITVGYDLVEHAPSNWNPKRDKKIVCIDTRPVRGRRVLHDRGRPRRRPLPHPQPPGRGAARTRRARAARLAAGRHRARPLRGRQGRRRVPDAAAARAVGDPPGARAATTC